MHKTVQNLSNIKNEIKSKINELKYNNYDPKIIAVSKTFPISHIMPLIESGHTHFGENKVQEALKKWFEIKEKNKNLSLHLVGKLQTNKVKIALKIFDFIHSLDNLKLAKKISEEQKKNLNKPKIFVQVNIGNENQKSGLSRDNVKNFYKQCQDLDLNVIGTMCLPPLNFNPQIFFSEMKKINLDLNLKELSMGMSNDYIEAVKHHSTYLRIGSNIFGKRN
tara:strand:+ start:593 stop:1255 length:663 start_codon:yes stop_codon:yes gene_type:complete